MPTMWFSDCDRNQEVNSAPIIHWLKQCLLSIDMPQRQHETLGKKKRPTLVWLIWNIVWLMLDLRCTFNGADNSTRCRIVREWLHIIFTNSGRHCTFSRYRFRLLESETSIFREVFFFFFLQCGFRALTSWRCDGIFRDLIIIVALIAFLGNTKHEQMQIWTYANPQKISVLSEPLEIISPVVHRWDGTNIRKMSWDTFVHASAT